jgi:hypothetical protein
MYAKQTQFERAQMNVRLAAKEDYENRGALRLGQNKPKQSQFRSPQVTASCVGSGARHIEKAEIASSLRSSQ